MLLHEAAHLARNDDWANLAMRILGGALALHPGWAATEPGGRVPVAESVAGMRGVIHRAGPHHTGSFLTYHDQPLPW